MVNLRYVLSALIVLGSQAVAAAPAATPPDPKGDWLVNDGTAVIHIAVCPETPTAPALCGVIAWTKYPPGVDENNPDPAKQKRSIMGMPILTAMKPDKDGRYEGEIYNAENGKTYQGRIFLKGPDVLRIEGCVFGFLCGGEDWTRTKLETVQTPPAKTQTPPAPNKKAPTPPTK
jgi:uncharacterized protein (DUF2147 family)